MAATDSPAVAERTRISRTTEVSTMEFRIKALDASSSVISCVVDAVDEAEARRQLALKDLKVISLEPIRRLRGLFQAPQLQLAVFSQQLVSLLDAGLSLVEALESLAQKESNNSTKHTLDRILARLYEGQTLAAAIAEHPATFPDLYVASVRASEKTGALREALTRYIAYQEQADALRKTLVNACIYPAVLLIAGVLVMAFLMAYVVPRFSAIYEDVGSDLPMASRLLLQWGQLIDAHAGAVAVSALALLGGAFYGFGRPAVRAAIGAWITRIPAVGRQLHIYQLARLYRTTGMLLRGGMPAVSALQMTAGTGRGGPPPPPSPPPPTPREGGGLAPAHGRHWAYTPRPGAG